MAEEQLIIEVKYEDHDAKKKVEALTSSITALNTATTGKGFTNLGNVSKSMAELAKAASGLDGIGKKFSDIADSSKKLFETFKSFDPKAYSNNIKSLTSAIDSISNAVGNLSQKSSGLQSVVNTMKQLSSTTSTDIGKGSNLSSMAGSAGIVSKAFDVLGASVKKTIKYSWQLGKLPFKMILSPIQKVGEGIMGMTNRFTTFLKGIGRIALYRAIRTGIKMVTSAVREGVNNLYIWAGMVGNSFKPTMDSLATSFMYLKNSIGAMVSPLLDALAPALETVVNQIVDVLNIFNQVIATMTGATTWRKALRAPASYADNISGLGHDAEDAADSVKELKRTILGFDEINKLEDKTKTLVPKNNGKDATGYYAKQGAFSFTEVPITKTALDISKMLKDAWNKADFTEIGNIAAQKIADTLNKIDWDKVKSLTEKFSSSLATFLNGLLDYNGKGGKALWDAVASTIYNGINTAVLGYTNFFDKVKWEGIGEGIGAALKKVCKNIKWKGDGETKGLDDALAAFPNAVIDTFTGFNEQFTVEDFKDLGDKIGSTVSSALTKIKWDGLFGNAITLATNVLAGINSALSSFDWKGVKDAIMKGINAVPNKSWEDLGKEISTAIINVAKFGINLIDTVTTFLAEGIKWKKIKKGIIKGIKAVSKEEWADMGKKIGNSIFNIASFLGNLLSIAIDAIKSIEWSTLISNIWTGIDEKVKASGGWAKAASDLASNIGKNLDVISLVLAFTIGSFGIKALASNFASNLMSTLMLKQVPGTGLPLGRWAKALTLVAGIALAISTFKSIWDHDFKKSSIKDNLFYTLKSGFKGALAGALIGFTLGGPAGAIAGATIGLLLTLAIIGLKWDPFDEKTQKEISDGVQSNIDRELADAQANLEAGNYNNAWAMYGDNSGNTVTSYQNRTYGAPSGSKPKWNEITVVAKPTVSKVDTKAAWDQLSKWWDQITKTNKVAAFMTKGVTNKATTWWSNVKDYWKKAINGQTANKFTIAGINNKASTWWSNVKQYWKDKINGQTASEFTVAGIANKAGTWWSEVKQYWKDKITDQTASRFTIAGIFNKAGTWWTDVKTYWKEKIEGKTASKFTVGGVYNKARSWWSDVKGYWSDVTSGKSLKASVTISNTYNVFVAAFNAIQTNFNKHPIVATVTTKTVKQASYTPKTKTVGGYTVDKNGAVNLPTPKAANGGVYKNGQWHDVTAFAAGGSPMSGQMFIAREAGPELVGTLGGNTAVLNNDQIVSSVASGVAQAVASVLGGGNMNEITIKVDSETLYRAVKKGERKASGRYGTAVAIG